MTRSKHPVGQPCERCERPVDDARICSLCGRDLERALAEIPFIATEIDIALARLATFAESNDRVAGKATHPPLPIDAAVSEVLSTLRAVLVGWTKLYAEEARADLPANTLDAMSAYLLRRVEWLRHHDAGFDAVDEITDAVRNCRRLIDSPTNRATFPVGPCPEADEAGVPCPGEVRAYIPNDQGVARLECVACHTMWGKWQWDKVGPRIMARQAALA